MKKILYILIFTSVNILIAQNLTPKEFVNVAGKQRMLSQKIAKTFLIKTYGELEGNFTPSNKVESDYESTKSLFEDNLESLILSFNMNSNREIFSLLGDEKKAWKDLVEFLDKKGSAENAMVVVDLANDLLEKSNNVVLAIQQKFSKKNVDPTLLEVINKSGRQRMLSQRLCMLFVAEKIENYLPEQVEKKNFKVDSVLDNMNIIIEDLSINKYSNTVNIEDQIKTISTEFNYLKENKSNLIEKNLDVNNVLIATNKLTNLFDDLTSEYTKI